MSWHSRGMVTEWEEGGKDKLPLGVFAWSEPMSPDLEEMGAGGPVQMNILTRRKESSHR